MKHIKTIILTLVFISVATRLSAQSFHIRYNPLQQTNTIGMDLFQQTDSIMMSLSPRFKPYAVNRWDLYLNTIQNHWTMVPDNGITPCLVDFSPFKCGPYKVPDPPPLFYDPIEDMSLGGCLINTLLDIILF